MESVIDKIISLAKRRGFIFQGSEIYGGLANTWDFGPLGVELKNNIKAQWWKNFVQMRPDVVGLDSAILMNPAVWEASGHVGGFSDPLIDCRSCKNRFRADKLLDEYSTKNKLELISEGLTPEKMAELLAQYKIKCPTCGMIDFTAIREFNLMFKTHQGVTETSQDLVYLRPETAQGIFINFKNLSQRRKLPFGVAQIGKAFRNEISPGNFIFRTREFEQMEIEYFCREEAAEAHFEEWQKEAYNWLLAIGLNKDLLKIRRHNQDELSHYSKATSDIEFNFPFGWGELWGIAMRGTFDLSQHQKHSSKDLSYFDVEKNEKFLPNVIEPSLGVDRLLLAILCAAYSEDVVENEPRVMLKLSKKIAPVKLGILSLTKKQREFSEKLAADLRPSFCLETDESGSIGRRYRRFDEIGTPYCLTIDFDTESSGQITVRDRDTTTQEKVDLSQLTSYLTKKLADG